MAEDQLSILAAAIEVEKFGYDLYMNMGECVKDKRGAALLRGLAQDEKEHRRILEDEIARISPSVDIPSIKPAKEYLKLIPDRVFPAELGRRCSTLEGEIEAVEIGIKVEVSSMQMYSEAVGLVSDARTKALLGDLGKWEGTHKTALEQNLHMLRTEGSWYGYTPILEG
ncbi:MAG: ferritin family protein [Methanomassiliicoccales archaeon]|nr:ferritin family protein [Methanomassiliicoccales archaeon]